MWRFVRLAAAIAVVVPFVSTTTQAGDETNWSGLYVGAHVGYGWDDWEVDLSHSSGAIHYSDPFNPAVNSLSSDDGWIGGFQAGGNQQFSAIVVGLVTDVSWTDFEGEGTFITEPGHNCNANGCSQWDIDTSLDVYGTVRGRVAFLIDPTTLIFGTGGLAWGIVVVKQATTHNPATTPEDGGRVSGDFVHLGWSAGGGVELMIAPGWSLVAEYLYVDLGKEDYAVKGTTKPGGSIPYIETFANEVDFHTTKVGVNYHF